MSSRPLPDQAASRSLPMGAMLVSAVLLIIPIVALALVGTYAKAKPVLWGFPFFYWYQFLWVFLASGCTWAAYVVVTRARRGRSGGAR